MALTATFYTFYKKENSTSRPSSGGYDYSITLKDGCGIVNPVILLTGEGTSASAFNPSTFNMVHISTFNRYYFIAEWNYERGMWSAVCRVDILASAKASITASTKYITRCSESTYWDGDIIDNYYQAKAGAYYNEHVMSSTPWGNPTYIIGVVNNQSTNNRGFATYYVLDKIFMNNLLVYLMGEPNNPGYQNYSDNVMTDILANVQGAVQDLASLVGEVVRYFMDPTQYIVSAKIFPFTPSFITDSNFHIGKYTFPVTSGSVGHIDTYSAYSPSGWTYAFDLATIGARHSQASARGTYLNGAPYMRYVMDYQPFGRIELDANLVKNSNYIYTQVAVDLVTGDAVLDIWGQSTNTSAGTDVSAWFGTHYAKVGCDIPLSQMTSNAPGALMNVALSAGNAPVASDISNIGNALQNIFPNVSNVGSNSGNILPTITTLPALQWWEYRITDANDADKGRPCCKRLRIGQCSGYIECADGDISMGFTQPEREAVSRYLTQGFYNET